MAPPALIVEFSLFPDDTVLGPQFTLSGYEFRDLGGSPSFVNVSGAITGLQFDHSGLRVKLPRESALVEVRAAALAATVVVFGKDSGGNVLYSATIPADQQLHYVQLTHPGIVFIEFAGGNNEGTVESISIPVSVGGEREAEG